MPTTNSLGTLAATGVFHDALGLLLKRLPFLPRLASDIEPIMGTNRMPFGVQQILKNYNATLTSGDRSQTGTYEPQAGIAAAADQYFTLSQWPFFSFKFTLVELNTMVDSAENADARQKVIEKIYIKAFNQLETALVNRLLTFISAANFPQSYVVPAETASVQLLGSAVDQFLLADALNTNQAPDAILSIPAFRSLANNLTAIANQTYDAGEVIRTGLIEDGVSGARSVARYNLNMPAQAANGFLLDPQGLVFANRVPYEEELPNDPTYQEIITAPETGFSILLREAKMPGSGEVIRTLTTLFDFAPGLAQHVVRLTED